MRIFIHTYTNTLIKFNVKYYILRSVFTLISLRWECCIALKSVKWWLLKSKNVFFLKGDFFSGSEVEDFVALGLLTFNPSRMYSNSLFSIPGEATVGSQIPASTGFELKRQRELVTVLYRSSRPSSRRCKDNFACL